MDQADLQRGYESGGRAYRLHHGAATRFEPTGQLFDDLIAEGEAVAQKLGIELHGDPRQLVQKGANAPGKHRASMLQDVLAKRQTEVDFMNGAIVQWGKEVGSADAAEPGAVGTYQRPGTFVERSGLKACPHLRRRTVLVQ